MNLNSRWLPLLLLFLAALAIRAQTLGHPLLHMDENFYLLVGDRMIGDGAWPYVDIWDRKPVGLFLLFAGFSAIARGFGGDAFVIYQIAALIAATGTAWLLFRMAAMVVERRYALVAGVIYLAYLTYFGGYGGQSPVYYNLLVAGGAWLVLRMLPEGAEGARDWPRRRPFVAGAIAMTLFGLAMQIKYSVVFEGAFFGLVALWSMRQFAPTRLIFTALCWMLIALLPTILAWATYASAGHGEAFVYANFISIFERGSGFAGMAAKRLASLAGLLSLLMLLAAFGFAARGNMQARAIKGWAITAVLSLLIFGTFYNHYGLPLVLPLSVMAALGLSWIGARWRVMQGTGLLTLATLFQLAGMIGTYVKTNRKGASTEVAQILSHLPPGPTAPCPWFTGTTSATLYIRSNACLPTRYPLSGHLFETHERAAIGIDPVREIDRIFARTPSLITMDEKPRPEVDLVLRRNFQRRLLVRYRLVDRVDTGKNAVLVYLPR